MLKLIQILAVVALAAIFIVAAARQWRLWYPKEDPMTLHAEQRARLSRLEELGYFKYTPESLLEQSREDVAKGSFPFYDEGSGRFFWADAENLAEQGVANFLEELRTALRAQGIELGDVTDEWEDEYWITVRGERVPIWRKEEWREARSLAPARAFSLVNRWLTEAGSPERLYAVSGDNDLVAVLMTDEIAGYISGLPDLDASQKPYFPTEEPPWYGYPALPPTDSPAR